MRRNLFALCGLAVVLLATNPCKSADLIIFSRAIPPSSAGEIPVSVVNVGNSGLLIALDAGLKYPDGIAVGDPNGLFSVADPIHDYAVSGIIRVVPGIRERGLYFGIVSELGALHTGSRPDGLPKDAVGTLNVGLAAVVPYGEVLDIGTFDRYAINDDTGGGWVYRPGATGDTDGPGTQVTPEPIRTIDDLSEITKVDRRFAVPLHMIAAGLPGDLNADGRVDARDVAVLQAALNLRFGRPLTAYERIVADVTGDGLVDANDLVVLRQTARSGISGRKLSPALTIIR